MHPPKTHDPNQTAPHTKAPEKGPFSLRCGRMPEWAVKELLAHYRTQGITASDEQAHDDLARLVELYKLVLRQSPPEGEKNHQVAPRARKTTYHPGVQK